LKILEGEGQVTYVAHRGYFVTELSLSDLLEVYRIREILEAEAVTVAVPQMTAEDIDRLEEAERDVRGAAEVADVVAMTAANRRFHFTLIEACALPRLVRLIRLLWDATEVYRSVYYNEEHNREVVEAEHRAVVTAVKAGDAGTALLVLAEHREHAIAALRPVLEHVSDGETALNMRRGGATSCSPTAPEEAPQPATAPRTALPTHGGVDRDGTAMRGNDFRHDRQAQPGTAS